MVNINFTFSFSITENVKAHIIQDDPIQGHEVHDVAASCKKNLCNIFLIKKCHYNIIRYNLTLLNYCDKYRPLVAATTS